MQVVPASSIPPSAQDGWGDAPTLAPQRNPLERPVAAIRRYKWLMLIIVAASAAGGVVGSRMVKPDYEVTAKIWVQALAVSATDPAGPIRGRELLNAYSWLELLRSFKISDAVVRDLALNITPKNADDAGLLKGLTIGDRYLKGNFKLAVDKRTAKWKLTLEDNPFDESGNPGDSIGRKMGLKWRPDAKLLAQYAGRDISFTLVTPRETSVELMKKMTPKLPDRTNIISVSFIGSDRELAARTLNAYMNEYVNVATDLKRGNTVEFAKVLAGQLQFAENSLKDAETALESFKVHTITLPSETGTPIPGGIEATRDPAIASFFNKKIELDNIKQDRIALEKVIAAGGTLPYESVLLLSSVANSLGGKELSSLFNKQYSDEAQLTAARQTFTDNYPVVRELAASVKLLKEKTIPELVAAQLSQVRDRETEMERRIGSATVDIQSIPARTIEEMRLKRNVLTAEQLYGALKGNYANAQLAAASPAPDVKMLDSAVAPLMPTSNSTARILFVAVFGGIGLAIGIAMLLDGIDKRILYPEQATELGLTISGTVPLLPKGGVQQQSPEQLTQLVESFRTLRMNVMHSSGKHVSLAVSSPSPGDGKSFIASNLAMSFADAGFRTVLVDGDTRRGSLHDLFEVPRAAGLTDFLAGEALQSEIIHPTGHDKLALIPSGRPRRQSPELLVSAELGRLVADLRNKFDVVIYDTPPLAAGIDGYAIASAAGSLLVVLRIAQTERRMANAKLALLDRLPIHVMGAVLNGAPSGGEYEYYGYVGGYAAVDEQLDAGRQVAQIS
jgi:capsular exopolysaccharide synthesis family protein